jgi:putative ABC transport system ATP-binding protein
MVNLVEVMELQRIYPMGKIEVHALRNINLTIEKGEFVAIMGPSGSGKSTLLNMIGMLDIPTSGEIIIDGIDTSAMSEKQRAEFRLKKIGFIFQFFSLLLELAALDNVLLPMMLSGENNKDRAMELLKIVGMGERALHMPNELSGGEQQRVTIARALVNKPMLLLADEPTANLDTKSSEQVVNLMRKLNKEINQTIVLVTHEPELGRKADRIIWLKDGGVEKIQGNDNS